VKDLTTRAAAPVYLPGFNSLPDNTKRALAILAHEHPVVLEILESGFDKAAAQCVVSEADVQLRQARGAAQALLEFRQLIETCRTKR
jgi:hypothetical protein